MFMNKEVWNKEKYTDFLLKLKEMEDLEYKRFHSKLGINYDYLIGIRVPQLKKLAKEISKTDYNSFIKYNTHETYEEILIHGLLLGYLKEEFDIILGLFNDYIKYIDNWALCDSTIANMHIWKHNLEKGFLFVIECLNSKNEWMQRVGFVLLLDYYINEQYIDRILDICNDYKTDNYYVKMAIAWLISVCYIKYPKQTYKFIKNNNMSSWIQNKSIQKIRESLRISKEEKDELLKWRK